MFKNLLHKLLIILLIAQFIIGAFPFPVKYVSAAYTMDNVNGIYTNNFASTSDISTTKSQANVNTTTGKIQLLKNTGSGWTPPFYPSGYVVLKDIKPLQVAEWGMLSIVATAPTSTAITVQVMDNGNTLFADSYLPNNSIGISTFPVDLSNVPVIGCDATKCSKPQNIRLKFTLTTSEPTLVTPEIDSLQFTWTVKQGDLSPSSLSTDAWPTDSGNQQRTNHSPYSNSQTYPAFRWVSQQNTGNLFIRDLFISNDKIIGTTWYSMANMFALDRDNGSTLWQIPSTVGQSNSNGTIAQNGTYYVTDMASDMWATVDTNTGQLKWTYNFSGGHGNSKTILASDGTIYTTRYNTNGPHNYLYAFGPDGTVLSNVDYPFTDTGATDIPGAIGMSMGADGTLYETYLVYDSGYNKKGGALRAIDPVNQVVKWEYPIIGLDGGPLIALDGTIYVWMRAQSFQDSTLYAINSDGTKKWEKIFSGGKPRGLRQFALESNGNLLALYYQDYYIDEPAMLMELSVADGSIIWSEQTEYYGTGNVIADGAGGFFFTDKYIDSNLGTRIAKLKYYDTNHNSKWQVAYTYDRNLGGYIIGIDFTNSRVDERGWTYVGLTKAVYNESNQQQYDQEYIQVFGMAPWTLSASRDTTDYYCPSGDRIITFTATTSMLVTNPLFGGDNQVQVVIDNGDKVVLTYDSTDSNGNTVWTGSYTIPSDLANGTHSYTVEASQAYLQTDIVTHFDSAPTESNNTGLTSTGNFVYGMNCGGGGMPPGWSDLPVIPTGGFKVIINNGEVSTSSSLVNLSFNAGADVKKMAISMVDDFSDAVLEDYSPIKHWDLCSKFGGAIKDLVCFDGLYAVYVKFYTDYGQSSEVVSSSITLKNNVIASPKTQEQTQQTQTFDLFKKYLHFGQRDIDVKRLQVFLNQDPETRLANAGPGSSGQETDFFGVITKSAVIKFQEKYVEDVLFPWHLTKGTGYVFRTTLAKINEIILNSFSR